MQFIEYGKEQCCNKQWLSPLGWFIPTGTKARQVYYRRCFNCKGDFQYITKTVPDEVKRYHLKGKQRERLEGDEEFSTQYEEFVYHC